MQIQNPSAGEIIREQAGLTLAEGFPQNLSGSVVPVMDMTPRFHRNCIVLSTASATSSATATLMTTSTSKKTYIVGVSLFYVKDATCDAATGSLGIRTTINGVSSQYLAYSYIITLTAQQDRVIYTLEKPILIDKGVTIQAQIPTFTTGVFARTYQIIYYEVD